MRVVAPAPHVVGALKTEQGDGQVGLDVGHRAGVLEQADHGPVARRGVAHEGGVADGGVVAADDDGVFEADGDAGERAAQVDAAARGRGGEPGLGRGEEDLGEAVGAGVGFEGELAIGVEEGEWGGGAGVDGGYEGFDRREEGLFVLRGEGAVVGG